MSRHGSPAKVKKGKKGHSPVRRSLLDDALEDAPLDGQSNSPERARILQQIEEINVELRKAKPLAEVGTNAISSLTKGSLTEIKSYANPPKDIMNTLSAVMTLLGKHNCDWAAIKKEMTDPKFC